MTSTRDVQDMLGLPGHQVTPRPKPSKKAKSTGEKRHGEGLWNKEIRSLIGERAPPTVLIDTTPQLKQKRQLARSGPVRCWQSRAFKNDARTDGLLLRHWRRTEDFSQPYDRAGMNSTPVNEEAENRESTEKVDEGPYRFAQFNHQVKALAFDHETYEAHLKKEGWTEDETRYLTDLYAEFYGKWHLVWDRYEWEPKDEAAPDATDDAMEVDAQPTKPDEPQTNGTASSPAPTKAVIPSQQQPQTSESPDPSRTLEDLKSRFYTVSASLLALETPPHKMTSSQYNTHETLLKYNPAHEATRKAQKAKQMTRTAAEKREEDFLIAELKRIYFGQERADAELRELRTRLDHSLTDDRNPAQVYSGSREIQELFNRVVKADSSRGINSAMNKPRRSLEGPAGMSIGTSMTAPSPTTAGGVANRKGTTASTPGTADFQSSSSGAANVRLLSPRAALRAGLSTHERLTPGIAFRSDRIVKLRTPSKSGAVNNKIASALAEMGVPDLVIMPTEAVREAMEELVRGVEELIKRRGEREKVIADAKVSAEVGRLLAGEEEKEKEKEGGGPSVKTEDADGEREVEAEGDDAGDAAEEQNDNEKETEDKQAGEKDGDIDDADADTTAQPVAESEADAPPEEEDQEEEVEEEKEEPAPAPTPTPTLSAPATATATRTRNKRSASVLSASSTGSGRPGGAGPKRQKSVRK